ncbi:MAG: serine/threonine protein kinase [Coprococcus sp.]
MFESADNRYRVERYLGEGGSGRVYLVVCQEDSCCYALKVSVDDEVSRVSLYREARILSSVVHPAFPTVREIWEAHGRVCLVMSYIRGRTLQMLMDRKLYQGEKCFEPDEVLSWMMQLAEGLSYLHRHSVIYRDLKPSNVMVTDSGQLGLIDFGAACILGDEMEVGEMGTPGFAPPEQYSHVCGPGPWTDVYGFGALLHFLLTGDYPAEKIFFFREIRLCPKSGRQWPVGESVFRRRQLRIMNQLVLECTAREPEKRRTSWRRISRMLYAASEDASRRRRMFFRRLSIGIAGLSLTVYLSLSAFADYWRSAAYERTLDQVESAESADAESILLNAIGMMPERIDAYQALYDAYMQDGLLSEEEWQQIQKLMRLNREYLKADEAKWVILSYQLGIAVYLQSDAGISKGQAAAWFQNVEEADMEELDLGVYDEWKYIWQKRAVIFRRWSLSEVFDLGNSQKPSAGSTERGAFWTEVHSVLQDDLYPEEPRWELAVYDRILGMMVERAVYDMQSENVSEEEIETVLTEINRRLAEDDGSARQNEKEIILEKEAMLRKRMQMAAEVRQ